MNYSVFTFNGLKRTLYARLNNPSQTHSQINVNDRRLAHQALALAQGELTLAKTEKKLLESELLLHQRRTAQLTAAMEGEMKAASLTIAKLQQDALKIKSDHIEEVWQLKAADEHSKPTHIIKSPCWGVNSTYLRPASDVGSATTLTAMTWCALKCADMFSAADAQTAKPDMTSTEICVYVVSIAPVAQIVFIPRYFYNGSVSKYSLSFHFTGF